MNHDLPFADRLLAWFDDHGRKDLPWQRDITPYRVWVSEIMLQQTQVATVIPYFERFMGELPTVHALAGAHEDHVLSLWTGLGYYSRARNLHRAARQLVEHYDGEFPSSIDALSALPGIGRSTAGAIASIAMGVRAAILDGNVKRVLARHHAVDGWPGTTAVTRQLWTLAEQHTPHARVADYTQAIMDLGATLCTRSRPECQRCPVSASCEALHSGEQSRYPGKKPKKTLPTRRAVFVIVRDQTGAVYLEKRPSSGIWGGLWSFPELEDVTQIQDWCTDNLHVQIDALQLGRALRHSFSHYHLAIEPAWLRVTRQGAPLADTDRAGWYLPKQAHALGLPAPVVRLLDTLSQTPPLLTALADTRSEP